MRDYFNNIYVGLRSFWKGLSLTFNHMKNKEDLVATLQYPNEKWPIPERNIGYDMSEYNVVRSRLHVDMDDCIGCLQCERACPVDCIKIDTIKPSKDSDIDCGITSHGTQKKLVVPRFTIDMTECMYCNLCVYPCPEECIYMVGGPNENKHEMDYEFSQYTRDGLIFEFATATDDEIISAGGEDYLKQRDSKKSNLKDGEELKGKEFVPEIIEKAKKTTSSASAKAAELTHKSFSDLDDKKQRGLAKKTFLLLKKKGNSDTEILKAIEAELKEKDLFNDQVKELLVSLSGDSNNIRKDEENISHSAELFDMKKLNDIDDKVARGLSKKIYIKAKKDDKTSEEILVDIESSLKASDKLSGNVLDIINNIRESL